MVQLRPSRHRLARRLLVAQSLVITAGAVTLAVVAWLVSPGLFHLHVQRALGPISAPVGSHLDQAFATALFLSLAIGIGASVVVALAVSWLLSSRIARPIEALSSAARSVAMGDLTVRAAPAPVEDELADLTATFNHMVSSLERTEETRRRLLSDLAHELRTPLATIDGYLEGLDDGVIEPGTETWTTMRAAATRLQRLIDDVALVSKAEEGRIDLTLESHDAADVVIAAAAGFRRRAEQAHVELRVEVDGDLPHLLVDRVRIHQVLGNLLDNALRHTPSGGEIVLSAGVHPGGVVIAVRDTGEGIPLDHLPHVFERFYRGDVSRRHDRGSGVGLTIARAIARAHGGELTASSGGVGTGATFRLLIPDDFSPQRSTRRRVVQRR